MEHVACPPIVEIAPRVYTAPPVTPDRWKELCKQIVDASAGGNSAREVVSEDVEAEACGGVVGMVRSVMDRTRCTGQEAVEIVRRWKDKSRVVDEEKFQKVNSAIRESSRKAMVALGAVEGV